MTNVHDVMERLMETDIDRLYRAADVATRDGDYEHAKELLKRARYTKRRAREEAAGVPNPWATGWR